MSEAGPDPIVRHTARALLIDEKQRLLLILAHLPVEEDPHVWLTPGGGLEGDETHECALRRELQEETGLEGVPLGPPVWQRRHVFPWEGKTYDQRERFFVVRVGSPDISFDNLSDAERGYLKEWRWWTLKDIRRSAELFTPRRLGDHLAAILDGRLPTSLVDVGR